MRDEIWDQFLNQFDEAFFGPLKAYLEDVFTTYGPTFGGAWGKICPVCGGFMMGEVCPHCPPKGMVKCPNTHAANSKHCILCRQTPGWVEELS